MHILICATCKIAFTPRSLVGHQRNTHSITITSDQLDRITERFEVLETSDIGRPPQICPPIEGLEVHAGTACLYCPHVCLVARSFDTHWSNEHSHLTVAKEERSKPVAAQTLFGIADRRQYFVVDPTLAGLDLDDAYGVFLREEYPHYQPLSEVALPTHDRDLSILVKRTGWYDHLGPYCTDTAARASLVAMAARPVKKETWASSLKPGLEKNLLPLHGAVRLYMENARIKARSLKRTTLRALKEFPMYVILDVSTCPPSSYFDLQWQSRKDLPGL